MRFILSEVEGLGGRGSPQAARQLAHTLTTNLKFFRNGPRLRFDGSQKGLTENMRYVII